MLDNKMTIDALKTKAQKKFGEGSLVTADEIAEGEKMTTGILALDVILRGGWPVNQWSEIIADESHGKTALALKSIAANQRQNSGFEVLWIAAEEFVPGYAKMLGVDLSRVYVFDTNVMEDAFNMITEALDDHAVDMIVIDSLPALVPAQEDDKQIGDQTIGIGARLSGTFFRKARAAGKRSVYGGERGCTGLIINQWREKIGVMYGDNRTTPGGKAKNFFYFSRVEVRRDDWILDGNDDRVGMTIKARLRKSKTGPPERTISFDFYFENEPAAGIKAGSVDRVKDVFTTAIMVGVLYRASADGTGTGNTFWHNNYKLGNRQKALQAMYEDPDYLDQLSKEVLDVVTRSSNGESKKKRKKVKRG